MIPIDLTCDSGLREDIEMKTVTLIYRATESTDGIFTQAKSGIFVQCGVGELERQGCDYSTTSTRQGVLGQAGGIGPSQFGAAVR